MNTTERKAGEVLAILDMAARYAQSGKAINPQTIDEARAAVAEVFAERDRLANIVRSHEKQILRMTAERAELLSALHAVDNASDYMEFDPESRFGEAMFIARAAIAKATGGAP